MNPKRFELSPGLDCPTLVVRSRGRKIVSWRDVAISEAIRAADAYLAARENLEVAMRHRSESKTHSNAGKVLSRLAGPRESELPPRVAAMRRRAYLKAREWDRVVDLHVAAIRHARERLVEAIFCAAGRTSPHNENAYEGNIEPSWSPVALQFDGRLFIIHQSDEDDGDWKPRVTIVDAQNDLVVA